jgi:hypothetical protein
MQVTHHYMNGCLVGHFSSGLSICPDHHTNFAYMQCNAMQCRFNLTLLTVQEVISHDKPLSTQNVLANGPRVRRISYGFEFLAGFLAKTVGLARETTCSGSRPPIYIDKGYD